MIVLYHELQTRSDNEGQTMFASNQSPYFQATENELDGRVILVTGAGDGIGRSAALSYARFGASVILLGKTVSKLEAVYDAIVNLGGKQPAIIPLDLKGATAQHYHDMAATIKATFKRLDGALLNAGMLGSLGPFSQIDETLFDDVMQVNVKSQLLMAQALLPLMSKTPYASLVFTSSGVGRKGRAYWGSYAISKFAIEGMMQTLADEYSNSDLRINAINPGATRTRMRASAYPAEDANNLKTPDELMPTYLYLMCDASREISGHSLDAQPK
jgi:NAD(P)-dependent dehydrogenase (short-subunit alcohol dehydrogenase family)